MKTRFSSSIIRLMLRGTLGLIACLLLAVSASHAQDVQVTGVRGLNFGRFYRSGMSEIPYTSTSAAEFTITGREGRNIRIKVTAFDLWLLWLITLNVNVTNNHCAYSLNNGVTWQTFTTGTLIQDVKIPNGSGTTGTVKVRVGGTVSSGPTQRQGVYLGFITVNASYK